MILDSVKNLFNERAAAIAEKYAHDDYGRIAGLSVIVNAEEMFETLIKPIIDTEIERDPTRRHSIYTLCVDLLHELMADLQDPQWQDYLLNISLAGIAQEVEIYRGGEVDLPPLQKVITEEVNALQQAINRTITVHGLQFGQSPELRFPY